MNCILIDKHHLQNHHLQTYDVQKVDRKEMVYLTDTKQIEHIIQVLKAQQGDEIKIGLLEDKLGTAKIHTIDTHQIVLTDLQLNQSPPKKRNITVILALPRPKVMRRLLMDMTALGVKKIIVVNSYRTEKSYWQSPLLKRSDEFVLEGLQQAVDTIAPMVEWKKRFKPFVEDELSVEVKGKLALVAHPYAKTSLEAFCRLSERYDEVVVCIGAEGGWIDYEVELLQQHGCQAVHLGDRILRTEAAVNVMLGAISVL